VFDFVNPVRPRRNGGFAVGKQGANSTLRIVQK
jgi:hypothetical protein